MSFKLPHFYKKFLWIADTYFVFYYFDSAILTETVENREGVWVTVSDSCNRSIYMGVFEHSEMENKFEITYHIQTRAFCTGLGTFMTATPFYDNYL
jgi:hypothetical protein